MELVNRNERYLQGNVAQPSGGAYPQRLAARKLGNIWATRISGTGRVPELAGEDACATPKTLFSSQFSTKV